MGNKHSSKKKGKHLAKHVRATNKRVGATERVQALALCSLRALNGEGSVAHSALRFLYRERGIMRCIMHFIIEPLDACPRVAELGKCLNSLAYCEHYLKWDKDIGSVRLYEMHTRKPSAGSHAEEVSILRSLVSLTERVLYLPEALYDIILILRFYAFQGERAGMYNNRFIGVDKRYVKQWLFTEQTHHDGELGTMLGDLVYAILLAMRAHPRDIVIQMLGFEAVDKISSYYRSKVGTVGAKHTKYERLAFAPAFMGDYSRITHDEASDIMSKALQKGKQKYREYHSDASKLWVELDSPPDCYPCNDKVTRDFFSKTWSVHALIKVYID